MSRFSERELRRMLRQARQRRQPKLYSHADELGEVWITERAVQACLAHLPNTPLARDRLAAISAVTDLAPQVELARLEIAIQAHKVWFARLRFQSIGQQEIIFDGWRLHVAVDHEGRVLADAEPWYPY
jgi:hypothetical protein